MRILSSWLLYGNEVIADQVLVPETIIEKFTGYRGRAPNSDEAMLWEFPKPEFQMFDMWGVPVPLGFAALDHDKTVRSTGVLLPWCVKFVICQYWIEFSHEKAQKIAKIAKIEPKTCFSW